MPHVCRSLSVVECEWRANVERRQPIELGADSLQTVSRKHTIHASLGGDGRSLGGSLMRTSRT